MTNPTASSACLVAAGSSSNWNDALSTSWPGIVPAITSCLLKAKKDVDARDKRGHDEPRVLRMAFSRAAPTVHYQTACLVMLLDLVAETGMPSLLGFPFFGVLSRILVGSPILPSCLMNGSGSSS